MSETRGPYYVRRTKRPDPDELAVSLQLPFAAPHVLPTYSARTNQVPPGWVAVPVEATNAMLVAGSRAAEAECMDHDPDLGAIWRAMLGAVQRT
jgi:hypothetical protein